MSFGAALRRERIRAGMTQHALARAAGVDPAHVNHIELDRLMRNRKPAHPSRDVVLRFADVLHLSPFERDRLLMEAGFAPVEDWLTRAIQAESALATLGAITDVWETQRGTHRSQEEPAGGLPTAKQDAYSQNSGKPEDFV